MRGHTAIIDIGSQKAVCFIGGLGQQGNFELYGSSLQKHEGLREQKFFRMESVGEAIESAIQEAEHEAKQRIRHISVGVPPAMLDTVVSRVKLNYQAPHTFQESDMDKMIESSIKIQAQKEEWLLLDSYIESFLLDGAVYKVEPVGQSASEFVGVVANTYIRKEFQEYITEVLHGMDIEIDMFVDALVAEANFLAPKAEEVFIVDVGYYQTQLLLLKNRVPVYRYQIEMGGYHVASDISYVLGITAEAAEEIKQRHVFGLDYMRQSDIYPLKQGGTQNCDYETIQNIIEARTREIGDLIVVEMEQAPITNPKELPLFITGGGISMMRGGNEFLQASLCTPMQKKVPVLPRCNSPNYYSAYGVLRTAIDHRNENTHESFFKSLKEKIIHFFTK